VLIKNTNKGTSTDDKGNFEFKKLKPGTYILLVSLLGYTEKEVIIEVKEKETTILKIGLQQTYAELKKVIVEARIPKYVETKTSESLRLNLPLIEVLQNIIVIPHQLLIDQGLVSMTQAIRTVSGIEKTYGELNDYSLIIRGTDATYNVFRNGVGGDWWNQQEDVAMLEKIEFVKGPAGFMGSMSEPGGFVNNVTKQPTKERIARLDAGFGNYNLMRLTADLGGTFNKKGNFYYRFVARIHKQERAFQFGKAIRYFICPSLAYEFNKKTSLIAEYNYMYGKTSGNNDGLPSINGHMFQLPGDFAVADAGTDKILGIDNYYRLALKHNFNDNWHLNVQAATVSGPWNGDLLQSDGDTPVSNDTLYRISSFQHYINYTHPAYAFIDGKFQTGRKIEHKVLFGLDYHNEGFKGFVGGTWGQKKLGLYIPKPDYYVNPDSLRNFEINWAGHAITRWIALYLQDHVKIADKLVVTLAGHLTHASNIWEGMIGYLMMKEKSQIMLSLHVRD
jgi:iron complex outermembrane receptor protein